MQGFFSDKEVQSKKRPGGKSLTCISCGLYKKCKTPKIGFSGQGKKGILNLMTMPSEFTDKNSDPYNDKYARLIANEYKKIGVDLHKDCINGYAMQCYSKTKKHTHTECCRRLVIDAIERYKPSIIICFGDFPLYSIIGNRYKKDIGSIQKWRGFSIPDQEYKAWIFPMISPENILKFDNKIEALMWRKDFARIADKIDKPILEYKEPEIVDISADLSPLNAITKGTIAFDYETTGLKPYSEGHKIICASVAVSNDKVFTFMIPDSRKDRKPFIKLLKNKNVRKVAQNLKFEDTWTKVRLHTTVQNWYWDTMQATHIIDNRAGITGLKFQTFAQFGIADYDSDISSYLYGTDPKNNNSLNRIEELVKTQSGIDKILKYCALDSIYEFRLYKLQKRVIKEKQPDGSIYQAGPDGITNAYKLMHDGILSFAKAERHGLRIDTQYLKRQHKKLSKKIEICENKFYETDLYKEWKKHSKGVVNIGSGDQLGKYLYDYKRIEPAKRTAPSKGFPDGKGSTDEDALKMLNIPELDLLIERKKLLKIRDTYLDGFAREQTDGILHPFFNLHTVVTYRSSSNAPNFQNIPKRDKDAMKICRSAIYPTEGNQLLEMDFGAIEVAIAACYHKDPNMIKYITDPTTDMHGDMAEQIFMTDGFDKHRKDHSVLRSCVKNSFVFPQFYGDYYKNCAANICGNWMQLPKTKWKKEMGFVLDDGSTIGAHLISKGIKSYEAFEKHIQAIEEDFWTNRFAAYAKWKENHWKRYQKNGYIHLKTGFTCSGIMGKNDAINYPVQGAAFHCLLWLFTEITRIFEERKMNTRIVGQIHDAVVFDVAPNELDEVYSLIIEYGTQEIKKAFKWINVPLVIEGELCPVDGSWAEKEDYIPDNILPF